MGKPRHSNLGLIVTTLSILAITAAGALACTPARAFAQGAPATIVAMPTTTPQSEGYGGDNNFPSPLQARVLDASGNPVPDVTVTFTAPGSGPTIAFPGWITSETQTTNANGIATSDSFCGVNSTGGFEVTASVPGTSPAVFHSQRLRHAVHADDCAVLPRDCAA